MNSVWGAGHDVCKPLQFGLLTTCCVALLVRCRVIRPHVPDQLPQEFQEHVTYLHGPDMWRNVNTFVNYGGVLRAATKLIFWLGRLNLRTCKSWTTDNNTAQNSATYFREPYFGRGIPDKALTNTIFSFHVLFIASCWEARASSLLFNGVLGHFGQRSLPSHSFATRGGPRAPHAVVTFHVLTLVFWK